MPARFIVLVDDHRADALSEIGALDDAGRDGEFLSHFVLEARHVAALADEVQRDLHRLRRFGREDRQLLLCPQVRIGGEAGEDLLKRIGGEQPVDVGEIGEDPCLGRRFGKRVESGGDRLRIVGDLGLGLIEPIRGQIVRGEAERAAIGAVEPRTGQRDIFAKVAGEAREIPAAADIGEQADPGLGHREARILGGDAEFGGHRYADPAAHRDPVHERDHRLGIGEQCVVELIFNTEEIASGRAVTCAAGRDHADVAAGAEAAPLGMVDHYRLDRGVGAPRDECVEHRRAHRGVERVDRLGPVEPDAADTALGEGEDIAHWRVSSRPTIMRMTWLVPSRIECTRRSRQKRSIG